MCRHELLGHEVSLAPGEVLAQRQSAGLSAPTCSEPLAEIPARTATLLGASHKMPKSVIYNMTGLKKCFHKLVSCCFALADKCFWNFPITMFYSLYLLYCYF